MADELIPFDAAAAAGSRLPSAVRTEIAVLPAVAGKLTTPSGGSTGQVLGKASDGSIGWQAAPSASPLAGKCHIIPGLGQSNNTQSDTSLPVAVDDDRLRKWDGAAIVPLPASETYLLPQFAREYAKTLPKGDWVLVVPAAVGSTSFTSTTITPLPAGFVAGTGTWDRTIGDPVNLPANAVTATNAAKAAAVAAGASSIEIPAMLWSQGEGDTPRLTEAQYGAKLDDLIAWFRTQVNAPNLLVLVGSMVPEYSYARGQANTAGVAAALARTPARVQRTAFVWGPEGLPKQGEIIHYSTAGQVVRGRLFLDALMRARVNVTATKPVPPTGLSVSRAVSGRITARWQDPLCRLTGYDVDYTVDSGTTWTAMALDRDSRLKATTVVTPDKLVQVRLRSKADGPVTASDYVYSDILFAVSGAPAPTESAATPIADPPLEAGGGVGTRTQFTGGESVSPAQTGAATLYAAFTLPASGGGITANARSNDSTRQLSIVTAQTAGTDQATATTGGGSGGAAFAAPKATPGPHVYAISISADGVTRIAKRGSEAAITATTAAGNVLIEALRVAVIGGATLHGAYVYYGVAHTESQMSAIQEELRALHGLTSI
ncbi:sialate O-acetylesterase [Rhodococcoides fascians]|uniref:sialate O-acetylesterase n=1 Tax=Rhodococcoides fascians TaxID=1828 RepID=UPI0009B8A9DF|nr:sialate O-acetylesterase [Rhodococcus fascians]